MALFIANGVDVDPSLTEVISFSTDGVNWSHVNKANISVHSNYVSLNPASPVTGTSLTQKTMIHIRDNVRNMSIISFDTQNVSNGAGTGQHTTWQGGTRASLQIAATEIGGWLS